MLGLAIIFVSVVLWVLDEVLVLTANNCEYNI